MDKIFITGGSGFIGRKLVPLLKKHGYSVRALSHSKASAEYLESQGAEVVKGDVLDQDSLQKGLEGCRAAFHLAGIVSFRCIDRRRMYKINVQGTRNVLSQLERSKVSKFIYCSSTAALGSSGGAVLDETSKHGAEYASAYERTKWLAHADVAAFSKRKPGIVIAMPSFVMGPGGGDLLGKHIKAFCYGKLPFMIKVNPRVSYVFVDDVAQGLYLCFLKGKSGEQYILSAEDCTQTELTSLLEKYSHRKSPRFVLSPNLAKPLLFIDEITETILGKHPLLTLELLRKLQRASWVYSGQKARLALGWSPRGLEQMVKETVGGILSSPDVADLGL